jgi:hypothetical protein
VRLQPDRESQTPHRLYVTRVTPYIEGFGYKWSSALKWEDLLAKKMFTIKCSHTDEKEAAFRFHACVEADLSDPSAQYVALSPSGVVPHPSLASTLRFT